MKTWPQSLLAQAWAALRSLVAAMRDNGRITQEQVRRVFP